MSREEKLRGGGAGDGIEPGKRDHEIRRGDQQGNEDEIYRRMEKGK